MVLRSQSVGEQDVADQQGAFYVPGGRDRGGRRAPFFVSLRFARVRDDGPLRLRGVSAPHLPLNCQHSQNAVPLTQQLSETWVLLSPQLQNTGAY